MWNACTCCVHALEVRRYRYICMYIFAQVCGNPELVCVTSCSHSCFAKVSLIPARLCSQLASRSPRLCHWRTGLTGGIHVAWLVTWVQTVDLTPAQRALCPLSHPHQFLFAFPCVTSLCTPSSQSLTALSVGPCRGLPRVLAPE